MKATNKAQMDSSIRKNSGTSKALLSIPGVVLGKSTGKLIDDAIGKRSTGSKLTLLIGKK
jgi:hypothetical protein